MVFSIQVNQTGSADVMKAVESELPYPQKGEVQIKHHAIGVNFIDTYFRSGLYPPPQLPFVLGNEAAGEIVSIGENVDGFQIGDRVAYAGTLGAYTSQRNITAQQVVKIDDNISYEIAASIMLKGMTARYLLKETYPVKSGDIVLYHAAAGGVGQIFSQWAKHLGATVIGTVGSAQKAEIAQSLGVDHIIRYDREDFVKQVHEITEGKGVDVVYDSIGKDTFPASLDCLKHRGMWVSFGQSSGALPDFNLSELSKRGSLKCTRPSLFHYIDTPERLKMHADDLFDVIATQAVTISPPTQYALKDAVQAHQDLEGRRTSGSIVLIP